MNTVTFEHSDGTAGMYDLPSHYRPHRPVIGTMVTVPSWQPVTVRVIDVSHFKSGAVRSVCVKLNGHIQWISPEGLSFA